MTTNTTSPRCVATVVRPVRGRVRVRLPFAPDNRAMLKRWCGSGTRPEWRGGAWHVGRDHLEQILTGIARERCCAVTIHLEHATQTKCTASCWGAQPRTTWSCVCSCGGRNHGNATSCGPPVEKPSSECDPRTMSKAWANGSTRGWRIIRARILQRDSYQCQIKLPGVCTTQATHVHHTHGKLVTGDDPRYLVSACRACNLRVGDPTKQPDPPHRPITKW